MATLFLSQQQWVFNKENPRRFPKGCTLFLLVVTTTRTKLPLDEIPEFRNLGMEEGSAFFTIDKDWAELVSGSPEQMEELKGYYDVYVSMQEELNNAAKELVD